MPKGKILMGKRPVKPGPVKPAPKGGIVDPKRNPKPAAKKKQEVVTQEITPRLRSIKLGSNLVGQQKAPNRPQLDKMSPPAKGYSRTTNSFYVGDKNGQPQYKTNKARIIGSLADKYNAEDAYYGNPANIPAIRKRNAVTTKGKPRGGK